MKSFSAITALVAAAGSAVALPSQVEIVERASSSIVPITTKGNAFFQGNNRFYIRGVDYQPGGSSQVADPIADSAGCSRDIAEFQKLGINTIRVYSVDNSANHDACMSALASAGIYLVLDVNTPKFSLRRDKPAASYNSDYLQNIFATIDAFAKYDNVLAMFSGNEVINDGTTTDCAPYVKAVTRDMKAYLRARSYRQIPVGYSAADVDTNRLEMAEYMNCGADGERADFFGMNDYSWCDPSSFTTSGWDQKVKNFTGYGIPLFLSEYGCNTNTRKFEEVASLYSTDMTSVYSGGLVYEYSQEPSKYGLVTISGSSVSELPDFAALQSAYKNTPNPSGDGGYNSTGGPSGCPATSQNWQVTNTSLPAMPVAAQSYFKNGAGSGLGLGTDKTSQEGTLVSGGQSAGFATTTDDNVATGSGSSNSSSKSSNGKTNAGAALSPLDRTPLVVGTLATLFTCLSAFML